MIYATINHWEDFKRASGRAYNFSDEAFQVLFQHFYEQSDYDCEDIEIHYDLFNFIEEYDSAIQAIPDEVYHEIKDELHKEILEFWNVYEEYEEYDKDDFAPSDEEIEVLALEWLHEHYDTVLDLPCCGGVIVFHDTKKP